MTSTDYWPIKSGGKFTAAPVNTNVSHTLHIKCAIFKIFLSLQSDIPLADTFIRRGNRNRNQNTREKISFLFEMLLYQPSVQVLKMFIFVLVSSWWRHRGYILVDQDIYSPDGCDEHPVFILLNKYIVKVLYVWQLIIFWAIHFSVYDLYRSFLTSKLTIYTKDVGLCFPNKIWLFDWVHLDIPDFESSVQLSYSEICSLVWSTWSHILFLVMFVLFLFCVSWFVRGPLSF